MELLRRHKTDDMLSIYKCFDCHKPEYYGMFHWHNGHQYCRACIYRIWQDEEYKHKKYQEELEATREDRKPLYDRIRVWQPSETDYVFPKYSGGVDYSEKEEEYENF